MPIFGRGTIRCFHHNASAMKKLAAHDFEDLLQVGGYSLHITYFWNTVLQCAIPVFEDLLPEPHNAIVLNLLFDLASWHGYAKLRMHTADTLAFFDTATTVLGQSVRKFHKTTCAYYPTMELPHEYAARGRREAALASKQMKSTTSRAKHKSLNLSTYKFHALGDYVNTIKLMGTTDNYTTQLACLWILDDLAYSFISLLPREN